MAMTAPGDHSPPEPLTVSEMILLSVSALCFAIGAATWNVRALHRSTPPRSPLVVAERDFFPAAAASALAACASGRPSRRSENGGGLGNAFSGTSGFVLEFNSGGIPDLGADGRFSCLAPYFDAVRDPDANAWVLNVVVCHASPPDDPDAPPISWHVDQSISVPPNLSNYAAHSVSVWYASVPEGMEGGELDIVKFSDRWLDRHGMASLRNYLDLGRSDLPSWEDTAWPYPDLPADDRGEILLSPAEDGWPGDDDGSDGWPRRARVRPRENLLITFRGDAHHRVLPFLGRDRDGIRVSIVLEQYHLPAAAVLRTARFRLR
mmetsp:Transcript_50312/g.98423  ORF Transcript_50312/g.98423 Transcript_50312/m.98423 type:complete len:320 (-) Transcript_50312:577-1536(-)